MSDSAFRPFWSLDPEVTYLNHGAFGACPTLVLEHQAQLRARLEAGPVRFMHRDLEELLDRARAQLATFLGAHADDLAFVPNATTGVNTVLRSLRFSPGDELLTVDHEYNASRNALQHAADLWGAKVVVAPLPWPVPSADAVVEAVLARVTPRTRLLLIDHVTSPTALVLPVERLVQQLRERGVETLVDGAHAPGMLPLNLETLGAAYYTGNLHKWVCAPKGAAFLHVRRDLQKAIRPLSISHGFNSGRQDRSQFRLDFDFTGTDDYTPFLCVPKALSLMGGMVPGGWSGVMEDNRAKALVARAELSARLGTPPLCPDEMVGSMAAVALPDAAPYEPRAPLFLDPLQDRLYFEHRIEVPVVNFPRRPRRHVRISAQLYNTPSEYERLGDALVTLLANPV
ncbi:aminotransferase class V-fold PLP-dependent enzyme [Aggregicoccus sp. 17bor-14]|uniref:aminotransferase class V-fold PLP-dependent enzyme n=1 Tax=Myxococcaceae TaxID=31 RepID=UPI00129CE96A|nr:MULTISPECIES: aminotransferase class V-fold PLP-dependent enzyme [Myxococcaceae]MBF5044262.1 aminotransferase class V-fold PLP-dependent enzyme [Simulacricoccus sp. 17bor-14]MRI90012.1 aminotransferase class V-fold PLP-dependent enzyme [Aggregicoccus sp. 17bor-14]